MATKWKSCTPSAAARTARVRNGNSYQVCAGSRGTARRIPGTRRTGRVAGRHCTAIPAREPARWHAPDRHSHGIRNLRYAGVRRQRPSSAGVTDDFQLRLRRAVVRTTTRLPGPGSLAPAGAGLRLCVALRPCLFQDPMRDRASMTLLPALHCVQWGSRPYRPAYGSGRRVALCYHSRRFPSPLTWTIPCPIP
jgi:hypothetical protein